MLKSLTLGQQIVFGILLPFVLLAATLGPHSYRAAAAFNEINHRVAHTQQVLLRTSELLSSLKDTETGQLGFLLTGKEELLAPYRIAGAAIDKKFEELRRLTADNPEQQQRLHAVGALLPAP